MYIYIYIWICAKLFSNKTFLKRYPCWQSWMAVPRCLIPAPGSLAVPSPSDGARAHQCDCLDIWLWMNDSYVLIIRLSVCKWSQLSCCWWIYKKQLWITSWPPWRIGYSTHVNRIMKTSCAHQSNLCIKVEIKGVPLWPRVECCSAGRDLSR